MMMGHYLTFGPLVSPVSRWFFSRLQRMPGLSGRCRAAVGGSAAADLSGPQHVSTTCGQPVCYLHLWTTENDDDIL